MDAHLYGRQSSTRWIPTPEQIRILKDLYYNQGVRSPTSEQIQRISSKLRQYGKIEGKNVFYWFQNHKARERQKMKLAMEISNSNSTFANLNDAAYGFAAANSPVFLDRSIALQEACFNGANAVQWEGCIIEHNVTMPWTYNYIEDDHNKTTRDIETLPLFPTHSQEDEEEEEEEKFCGALPDQADYSNNINDYNYYMQPNNGYNVPAAYYCNGNGADSLELTLNSYYRNRS